MVVKIKHLEKKSIHCAMFDLLYTLVSLSGNHNLTTLIPIPLASHAQRASLCPLPCHSDNEVSEPGDLQTVTQDETPLQVAAFVKRWCQIPGLQRQHALLTLNPPTSFFCHGHADALIKATAASTNGKKYMSHHHLASAVNSRKQITIME